MSTCSQIIGADCAGGSHREIFCDNEAVLRTRSGTEICASCFVRWLLDGALDDSDLVSPIDGTNGAWADVIEAAMAVERQCSDERWKKRIAEAENLPPLAPLEVHEARVALERDRAAYQRQREDDRRAMEATATEAKAARAEAAAMRAENARLQQEIERLRAEMERQRLAQVPTSGLGPAARAAIRREGIDPARAEPAPQSSDDLYLEIN